MINTLRSLRRRLKEEEAKSPATRDGQKEQANMIRALRWIIEQIKNRYQL